MGGVDQHPVEAAGPLAGRLGRPVGGDQPLGVRDLVRGRGERGVGDFHLARVDRPLAEEAHRGGPVAGDPVGLRVPVVGEGGVDRVHARRARGDHDARPRVVPDIAGKVDERVEVGVDPRALGGGEVARPEDDRLKPVARGGDLVDVLQAFGLLDQHFKRDPLAQPERLLELGQQRVDPPDIARLAHLGHDDHVERLAGDGDDLDDVAVGPAGVDAVHPDRAGGAPPVEIAQRPGRLPARLLPLGGCAGVLEVEEHQVGAGGGGLREHVVVAGRGGQL